jgi:hypothetical protein
VLFVSAILNAPWQGLLKVSYALGVCGILGVVYGIIVIQRARGQTTYRPVFEDWLWHTALPILAYLMLVVAAFTLRSYPRQTLFVIGGSALLLLFVGIHNAWDAVTYITIDQAGNKNSEVQDEPSELKSTASGKKEKERKTL